MGIIAIFIAVSNMFVDSGMGASLIKKDRVTVLDYSTLFWYNIIVSLLIYFLIFIFSDVIADFYGILKLSLFIKIIGFTIVINSISIVQNIQLVRNLRFKHLAVIAIFSNVFSVLIAIILSVKGYGIWALVIQQLALSIMKSIGLLVFNRFLPLFRFSIDSFKEQFVFGSHLLLSNLLKSVYDNIYSSAMGKLVTPVFTGYYVQANKLQNIPVNLTTSIVDRAMFPVLSRIQEVKIFKGTARSLSKKVLLLIAPVLLILSVSSSYVIDILLGDKWSESAWILSILCFAGISMCIQALNRNILKSLGATKKIFQIEILKVIIGLGILMISLTLNYNYIIWGIFLSSVIACLVSNYVLSLEMQYSIKEQMHDVFLCLFPAVGAFFVLYIFDLFFVFPSWIGIFVNVILYALVFFIIIFVFNLSDAKYLVIYCFKCLKNEIKKSFFHS